MPSTPGRSRTRPRERWWCRSTPLRPMRSGGPASTRGTSTPGPPTRPGPHWKRCSPLSRGCLPSPVEGRWRRRRGWRRRRWWARCSGRAITSSWSTTPMAAPSDTSPMCSVSMGSSGAQSTSPTRPTSRRRFDRILVSSGWRPRPTRFSDWSTSPRWRRRQQPPVPWWPSTTPSPPPTCSVLSTSGRHWWSIPPPSTSADTPMWSEAPWSPPTPT